MCVVGDASMEEGLSLVMGREMGLVMIKKD